MGRRWDKIEHKKQFKLSTPRWQLEAYDKHLVKETMRELTQDAVPEEPIYHIPSLGVSFRKYVGIKVLVPNHVTSIKMINIDI